MAFFLVPGVTVSQAENLDFSKYPRASEISYGGVVAQVRPKQYIKLKAPLSGSLHLKVKNGTYEKGTVWAEFEPEQIALEREAMELTKSLHKLKEMPMVRLEMADSRAVLENRRDELQRNLAMMDEILAEPDLAALYLGEEHGDVGNSQSTVREMQARLQTQLSALEDALAFVGTAEQERVELRLAQLQIDRKDTELQRKEQESKLKLPFSGDLRYLAELPDDPETPLIMQSGDEIAEISDFSTLECDMVVSRSVMRHLPTSSLILEFPRQSGPPLRAEFERKESAELFGKPELIYIFGFPSELAGPARQLIGGRVSANVIVKLSTEAILVPKLDLVRSAPEIFSQKGWLVGVESAFPGFRAIAVGQSQVAVVSISSADD